MRDTMYSLHCTILIPTMRQKFLPLAKSFFHKLQLKMSHWAQRFTVALHLRKWHVELRLLVLPQDDWSMLVSLRSDHIECWARNNADGKTVDNKPSSAVENTLSVVSSFSASKPIKDVYLWTAVVITRFKEKECQWVPLCFGSVDIRMHYITDQPFLHSNINMKLYYCKLMLLKKVFDLSKMQ